MLRGRRILTLLAAPAAVLASSLTATTGTAAVPGVPVIGRVPLLSPCINQTATGVDSALGVAVIEELWVGIAQECQGHPFADLLSFRVVSLSTLRVLSDRVINYPASAAPSVPRKLTMDEVHHRVFAYLPSVFPGSPSDILVFSTEQLVHGTGRVNPVADLKVASNPVQGSTNSPSNLVPVQNPTGPAGDFLVVPTGLTYDPASDSLYAMLAQNYGNVGSSTSAHGSGATDVYLGRINIADGSFAWLLALDQCTYSLKFTSATNTANLDDPVAVVHDGSRSTAIAGCVYTRSPTVVDQNQFGSFVQISGSMLSYTVPLDGRYSPVAGGVTAHIGRPNVLAGVADAGTGRMFWPALPPATQGGNSTAPAAVVFDAAHGVYTGAPTIAGPQDLGGVFMAAVAGNRYYSVSRAGVIVGDATATPPGQGIVIAGYSCPTRDLAVDARSRLLFVRPVSKCDTVNSVAAAYYDVLRDDLPSVSAPPAPDPDSYTTQVNESPTTTVAQFSGHAEATGSRLRLVGGTAGLASGATLTAYDIVFGPNVGGGTVSSPLDTTSRELDLGVVQGSNLDVYQASSNATAATADDATAKQVSNNQFVSQWPFKEVHCSDPGSRSAGGEDSSDTGAVVACDESGRTTSAQSSAGPLGLTVKLAGQGAGASLPVSVGESITSTHVWIDASRGVVAEAHAISRGISTGVATIDSVEATVQCVAHGRTGTASCTYHRLISGAAHGGVPVGSGACVETDTPAGSVGTCTALLGALNALQPGQVVFAMPDPDREPDTFGGSPGGYQSVGKRELYEHLQDDVLNYDSSNLVPGLEVTYVNDSAFNPSRLNLQLAGTESESHYGIHPAVNEDLGTDNGSGTAVTPVLPVSAPALPAPAAAHAPTAPGFWTVVKRILHRIFDGIGVLLRSPLTGLVVAALLLLLASPLGLAWRRRCLLVALSGGTT